jgi:hypothetical protein
MVDQKCQKIKIQYKKLAVLLKERVLSPFFSMQSADEFLNSLLKTEKKIALHSSEEYNPGEPSDTILLHGISFSTQEQTIEHALRKTRANITSVRLIRDKTTGSSRGFCFATFLSIEKCVEWVNRYIPTIEIDGIKCRIEYAKPLGTHGDWTCADCGAVNFKK